MGGRDNSINEHLKTLEEIDVISSFAASVRKIRFRGKS
jgi:hypothetical protein